LQPGGEVGRLADDRLFQRRAFADQVADDYEASRDPDPRSKLNGLDIEPTDGEGRIDPKIVRAQVGTA